MSENNEQSSIPHEDTPAYTRMTAEIYDAIYSWKDYEAEAERLKQVIAKYKNNHGNELLEVACGTGRHLEYLQADFQTTGVDLSEQQLVAAKQRLPALSFIQGDMRDFYLGRKFDVVTCLFSSIGYAQPLPEMQKAIRNMAGHLKSGGVLIVESWISPDIYDPNREQSVDTGELPNGHGKVTRTAYYGAEGNISILTMHHRVETPDAATEFTEEHRLAMYTKDEYRDAFEAAGLEFFEESNRISGGTSRPLYIGVMPT